MNSVFFLFFCSSVSQNRQDVLRGSNVPQSSAVLIISPFLNVQHHQLDGGSCSHSHPCSSVGMGWDGAEGNSAPAPWLGWSEQGDQGADLDVWDPEKLWGSVCWPRCWVQLSAGWEAEIQPDPAGPEQDGLDEQQGWAVS